MCQVVQTVQRVVQSKASTVHHHTSQSARQILVQLTDTGTEQSSSITELTARICSQCSEVRGQHRLLGEGQAVSVDLRLLGGRTEVEWNVVECVT